PPACGGPVRNAIVAAAVITFADSAAADPATPSSPWVPMSPPIEERCGPMEGPRPSLPVTAARFGTPRSDEPATLLILDLSAALRAGLPTFFGTLPFALPDSTIHQAFGNHPMGLA